MNFNDTILVYRQLTLVLSVGYFFFEVMQDHAPSPAKVPLLPEVTCPFSLFFPWLYSVLSNSVIAHCPSPKL